MLRRLRLPIAAIATLSLVATLGPASQVAAGSKRVRTKEIAPGLTFTKIVYPNIPRRVRMLTVDLSQDLTLDVALANDKLPYHERTSSMAARHGAIAAINGDYGRPTGRPVMNFALDGEFVQTALAWGVNFAVDRDETAYHMKHPKVLLWARDVASGIQHDIHKVNAGPPAYDEMALFTMTGGRVEKPPRDACSARLHPSTDPTFTNGGGGIEGNYRVDKVVCRSKPLARMGGVVLSAPLMGAHSAVVGYLVPGQEFALGWAFNKWINVLDSIGGNPKVVREGEVNIERTCWRCNPPYFMRNHPRTAVGYDVDTGLIHLVAIDGRRPKYSKGVTPFRLAKILISLGIDEALNLDGGGSTTMVINGQVVNRPSDPGGERAVSSALLVLQGEDPDDARWMSQPEPSPSPTASPSSTPDSRAVWSRVARDGGSTGGLADYLMREGYELSPVLRKAARTFRNR